jgi:hypothetical protein
VEVLTGPGAPSSIWGRGRAAHPPRRLCSTGERLLRYVEGERDFERIVKKTLAPRIDSSAPRHKCALSLGALKRNDLAGDLCFAHQLRRAVGDRIGGGKQDCVRRVHIA